MALMVTGFYACKTSSTPGSASRIPPDVNKASEQALFNTYSNADRILSYTLNRHVYLPGVKDIDHLENYHGMQFLNDQDEARINIDGSIIEKKEYQEFNILPEFGEDLDRWLAYLPNPLFPSTFQGKEMARLRPLFRQGGNTHQPRNYSILTIDKNWIIENIPQQEIIVLPDRLSILTDPEKGTIYQYIFEFKTGSEPISKHVISFEDYTDSQDINYPQTITRTTYLKNLTREEEEELQEQIVQNLSLMETYEENKSKCQEFENKDQRKFCRNKWERSIEALEIINEMMIDRVNTLVYEIKMEDVRLQ